LKEAKSDFYCTYEDQQLAFPSYLIDYKRLVQSYKYTQEQIGLFAFNAKNPFWRSTMV